MIWPIHESQYGLILSSKNDLNVRSLHDQLILLFSHSYSGYIFKGICVKFYFVLIQFFRETLLRQHFIITWTSLNLFNLVTNSISAPKTGDLTRWCMLRLIIQDSFYLNLDLTNCRGKLESPTAIITVFLFYLIVVFIEFTRDMGKVLW